MTTKKSAFMAMEKAALVKEIHAIGRDGNKLNVRIQVAALNAIHYSIAEGYIQYGSNLVNALNNAQRKQSLVTFLEKHGKFRFNKTTKEMEFLKRDDITVDSVGSIDEQWYEAVKPAQLRSSLDIEESFEKWLKRMEAEALKMDKAHKSVKHKNWLKAVAEFHAQWAAEQVDTDDVDTDEPEMAEETKADIEGREERRRTIRKAA